MANDVHVHDNRPVGDGGGGAGWIVALLVVVILVVVLWFVFARGGTNQTGVPDQIEVDINMPDPPAAPQGPPPQ
jgi:hypothetical protein